MKTSEELQNMKVVDLRSYAKELGIKNVKTYVKENLIKEILIKESASAKDIQEILNELKSSNFIGLEHWLYDPTIFTDRETGEESIRLSKQYWAKNGDDLRKVEEEEMESNLRELKERYGDCFRIENKNSHVLWIKSKKGKTQPKAEEPVVEVEESAKSIEINPMITEEPSFCEFVEKYNGTILLRLKKILQRFRSISLKRVIKPLFKSIKIARSLRPISIVLTMLYIQSFSILKNLLNVKNALKAIFLTDLSHLQFTI